MTDFTPWIRPTLKGPFLTSWGFTTLAYFTVGMRIATFGYFDDWLVSMLMVSFFAGLIVCSLIASDLVLLRSKMRRLPTGIPAWASALLAPIGVWFAWSFFGFGDGDSVLEVVVRIAAPILAVPFALRTLLGSAP
jgi:hypothetical protein